MSIETRLQKLEARQPLPQLVLTQDWHDGDLFRDAAGHEYRRGAESWPDEEGRHLLLVVWDPDWRGPDDARTIQLSWGDDDGED